MGMPCDRVSPKRSIHIFDRHLHFHFFTVCWSTIGHLFNSEHLRSCLRLKTRSKAPSRFPGLLIFHSSVNIHWEDVLEMSSWSFPEATTENRIRSGNSGMFGAYAGQLIYNHKHYLSLRETWQLFAGMLNLAFSWPNSDRDRSRSIELW
jgi:hypothetical protein